MSVVAITPFRHGESDGTITHVAVGEPLPKSFSEDDVRMHIAQGSAVDTSGKLSPLRPEVVDDGTAKRDEILAKAGLPVAVDNGNPRSANEPQVNPADSRQVVVQERIDVASKDAKK